MNHPAAPSPRPLHRRAPTRRSLVAALLATFLAATTATAATPPADKPPFDSAASRKIRTIDSEHYTLHTDLQADLADDLVRRMDAMFAEYQRRFADFVPPNSPDAKSPRATVYVFARHGDYARLTGDILPNSSGIFMPARGLVAAYLGSLGRDNLRRTLQHEAFHQFAHAAFAGKLPIWLNEGIAQVFEESLWTGDNFLVGQVPPRRVRQLLADISADRLTDFRDLMALTPQQWASKMRNPATAASMYNQAWAMVHFLVYATDEAGNPRYRARFIDLLKRLRDGQDPDAAFRAAFSDNIDGFRDRFVEWAKSLSPTPLSAWAENQEVLAEMLRQLDATNQPFNDIADFRESVRRRQYRLTYTRGQVKWRTAADPLIYFADLAGKPLGPDRLRLESRSGAPIPDLVSNPEDGLTLRTRFHTTGNAVEYELLLEPAQSTTSPGQILLRPAPQR